MFTLTIETDNDWFIQDGNDPTCAVPALEFQSAGIVQVLRTIANKIERVPLSGSSVEAAVRDGNGNTIGKWTFADKATAEAKEMKRAARAIFGIV
jgi:hypothetical protein